MLLLRLLRRLPDAALDELLLRLADRARYAMPLGAGSGCNTGSGACSCFASSNLSSAEPFLEPGREPGGLASEEELLEAGIDVEVRPVVRVRACLSISERATLDERIMLDLDPDLTCRLATGGDEVDEMESF